MTDMPLVTIVTPIYNHEAFINEYIDSVLNQEYKNIELILIDDKSNDSSVQIVEERLMELQSKLSKVVFIKNDINQGVTKNCNLGLKHSSGKYICFFASDDIMLSQRISRSIEVFESNNDVYMTFSKTILLLGKKKKVSKEHEIDVENLFLKLLTKGNFISAPTITYRNEGFKKVGFFNESLMAEDYDMLLRFTGNFKSYYINEPLCIYRLSQGSLSNSIEYKKKIYKNYSTIKNTYLSSYYIDENIKEKIAINDCFRALKTYYFYTLIDSFKQEYEHWLKITNKPILKSLFVRFMRFTIKTYPFYRLIVFLTLLIKYRSIYNVREIMKRKEK